MSNIKADPARLRRGLAEIIASQIIQLRSKQRKQKGMLDSKDVRQLKILSDAVDDQIKLQRMLDADNKKALEGLPDEQLEALANAKRAGKPPTGAP